MQQWLINILENVEHCGGEPEQARYYVTDAWVKYNTSSSQVSHMPAISPARATNVATHAWT